MTSAYATLLQAERHARFGAPWGPLFNTPAQMEAERARYQARIDAVPSGEQRLQRWIEQLERRFK